MNSAALNESDKEREEQEAKASSSCSSNVGAMMVLIHFCELHGPSILLCTQIVHSPSTKAVDAVNTTP